MNQPIHADWLALQPVPVTSPLVKTGFRS